MNHCEQYAALLDLYVDGELSPGQMLGVQAHLDECPSCQAYVDDALAIRAAFPQIEDTVVPEGFAQRVCTAIQESPPAPRQPRSRLWGRVLAPLAACCAIVILLRSGPWTGGGQDASAPEAAAAQSRLTEDIASLPSLAGANCASDGCSEVYVDPPAYMRGAEQSPAEQTAPKSGAENGLEDRAENAPEGTAEVASQNNSPAPFSAHTEPGAESGAWIEHENVVFSRTVFCTAAQIGGALEGFIGKPYSDAAQSQAGILGTGYALEPEDFDRILRDILGDDTELSPAPGATTELCCIVVTD